MELTQERLKELLTYSPETGLFYWLASRGGRWAGSEAGTTDAHGYTVLFVDGEQYKAHRLAWFYMKGEWPDGEVDHRDTNRKNNIFKNLREATRAQQNMNMTLRKDNSTGFKGVSFHKVRRKYFARIKQRGRQICLGYFDDPNLAHAAYCVAAKKYHGEFARVA